MVGQYYVKSNVKKDGQFYTPKMVVGFWTHTSRSSFFLTTVTLCLF